MREAIRALEAGNPLRALCRLLDLWPTHRNADLAEQIDRLGAHLDRGVEPLPDKRVHASWMQRVADQQPADVVAMMNALESTSKETKARVDALLSMPPDPRTTAGLLRWANQLHSNDFGPWGKVWTALFKVTLHVGDPRMRDGLQALSKRIDTVQEPHDYPVHAKLQDRIDKTLAKFPDVHDVNMDPALVLGIDAALEGPPPHTVYRTSSNSTAEILDLIYADPMDDGASQVWADQLQEAGDELGTWLTLQLRAETTAPTQKTRTAERKFRRSHPVRLAGPLAAVVDPEDAVYRRGLLYAARITLRTKEQKQQLGDHPAWRTVVQTQTQPPHLRSGALPNVRRYGMRLVPTPLDSLDAPTGYRFQNVTAPSWTAFTNLAASSRPLPLTAACTHLPDTVTTKHVVALKQLQGMPDLEELHLCSSRYPKSTQRLLGELMHEPLLKTVPRLVLDQRGPTNAMLVEIFTQVRDGKGATLVLLDDGRSYEVRRDNDGLHLHIRAKRKDQPANMLLMRIGTPSDWTSITIDAPGWTSSQMDPLEQALSGVPHLVLPKRKRTRSG